MTCEAHVVLSCLVSTFYAQEKDSKASKPSDRGKMNSKP